MAIHDLFWACPLCSRYASLRAGARGESFCCRCGTRFRRAVGARIAATPQGAVPTRRTVPQWEADLPPVDAIPENATLGPQPVLVRRVRPATGVRRQGQLLGWAEEFGPQLHATAQLDQYHLMIHVKGREPEDWPLESITAVQPSSTCLQINSTARPLVSISFTHDSVRRWEALLQRWIRDRARTAGRGEITQFHPRIRFA